MSAVARRALQVRLGFATEKGRRPSNQDYVGAYLNDRPSDTRGIVAAIADGVGGHLGGREAAELTIRSFIDAYYALPETLGVQRAAFQSLEAINQWIHAQGRHDAKLAGMSCTFSALILRRRSAHILHVGDSRIYCLSQGRIERLTSDHVMGRGELAHVLLRAVGFEESIKVDHAAIRLRQHDRLLLCTDGVHGALNDAVIGALLNERRSPEESARAIVQAALDAPSQDNASALVIDVVDVPAADEVELAHAVSDLPILALPKPGDAIDEFILGEVISDGRYSRVFRASDAGRGPQLALKFPHPRVAAEASHRLAFVREAWVAARVRNPWIGEIVEPPAGRQTRLYSVMPFYDGETLERRLMRSSVRLEEGVRIAVRLSRALDGLHRVGVIHRDVKPDNVILVSEDGLRLVDLGVARVRGLDDFPVADIPGTPSYMAPELFHGQAGDEASDLYALGVTIYRSFTGAYPYGEIEPFMTPRFAKYISLLRARPDLPAWLDVVLAKAVSFNAANRFHDAIEFAYELEHGVRLARPATAKSASLYERSPVTFWKMTTLALLLVVIALVIHNAGGHLR